MLRRFDAMKITPIRNEKGLQRVLMRIDEIIDAKKGTAEYDELDVLSTLVEAYENQHHQIDPPDPIEAIKFRMEQQGLRSVDLAPIMGGKNRVSEVLSRKRPLSLKMIRSLHQSLNIPYESLMNAV
jgi:HTH-type transcriptional regulator/antitoxin HigA